MKKTILKIMAFILPITLILSYITVFSANELPNTLYVGSTQVISGGAVTGATSGDGWEYDSTSNTLNLTGANIEGVVINSGSLGSFGIYADGDLKITFSDTNYVKSPGASRGFNSKGILVTGELTLSGTGTLNVESLDTTTTNGGSYAIGMHAVNGFYITSGTVNIRSGNTSSNTTTGISTSADSYVSGNAVLNVSTGDLTGGAYIGTTGISINSGKSNLYVSENATVTAMSGKSDYSSAGIYGNVVASGTSKITATASEINVAGSTYSYAIRGAVTISDSAVVIGESQATNPDYFKFGIYGDVTAEDGYYWRTSTSGDYTKSGTQTYNKTSSSYAELKGHTHTFGSYEHDEHEHSRTCTADCPIAHREVAEHSYDNGVCVCGVSIPFKITEHPQSQTLEYRYSPRPKLTVTIESYIDADKIQYQWYENGQPITNATKNEYYVPGKKVGKYEYYCEVSTTDTSYYITSEKTTTAIITIEPKSLADCSTDRQVNYEYTGEIIKKFLNVRVDGSYLEEGTDYIVTFVQDGEVVDPINAGEYTLRISGINNYKDVREFRTWINQATPKLGEITYSGVVTDKTKPEDVILNRENESIPGVLALDSTNVFELNKKEYTWTFTPTDTANYKTVTGTVEIDVRDIDLPTAEIEIGNKSWNAFDNTALKYELFSKEPIVVNVTAKDNEEGSGLNKVEYYVTDGIIYVNEENIPEDAWVALIETDGKYTFTIENNMSGYVYVRATDNHNNKRIINTSGIVKYEEVTDITKSITYAKLSDENVFVEIDFKGNTVKSIKYNESILSENKDYFVSTNGISFNAEYLNTFAAGSGYEFIISYNAHEIETEEVTFTTLVNLTVQKTIPEYKVPTDLEGTYGDKLSDITLPDGFTWDAPDTLLSSAGANKYKATYTPVDTDNYGIVKDIEISVNVLPKNISNATVKLGESLIYNGKVQTQTVKSIILEGENVTYKVTGNKATNVGNYKLTIEGTENYSGTIIIEYKVSPNTSILDNLTEGNVAIKDKEAIEDLKQSIENAEITEKEKEQLQEIIDKCDGLLEKIEELENAEEVTEIINKIPDDITEDDMDTIMAAVEAYNNLSEEEKSLIDSSIKTKLEEAEKELDRLQDTSNDNNVSETKDSNSIFWGIILVIVAGILTWIFIAKRNKRLAN